MRIIARRTLKDFWESGHANAEGPLKAWYAEVNGAEWNSMADIKVRYPHASVIDSERVVFNVGGNNYRLVVKLYFPAPTVFIRFVGTHAEYDRLDVKTL
ncbi:MAG: mRNA interferase HigB [Myxococcota bacterium]|jgi:mRNA interferase HigB